MSTSSKAITTATTALRTMWRSANVPSTSCSKLATTQYHSSPESSGLKRRPPPKKSDGNSEEFPTHLRRGQEWPLHLECYQAPNCSSALDTSDWLLSDNKVPTARTARSFGNSSDP